MRDSIKTIITSAIGPVYGAETYIEQATGAVDVALAQSLAALRREARGLGASEAQIDAALIASGLMVAPEPPAQVETGVPATTVAEAIRAAEQHIAQATTYLNDLRARTGV